MRAKICAPDSKGDKDAHLGAGHVALGGDVGDLILKKINL